MASAGTVVITMDADVAKVVEGIKKTNKQLSQFQRSANKATKTLSNIATAVAGIYVVQKAFDGIKTSIEGVVNTSSEFETYTNRMTAFTQGQAQANAEVDRGVAFALKYRTSINDTMDALLLMKNYGLDDSDESLKIFTNTAIGSGKSLSQYAEAVADALTGENERLKEFGLKASKIGEKIGYVWTDSAGKTRNVIIENNKEIINSTLNAIMNEKYVGQLEKRASSWAGLMQNMSNNFTLFQKNIGDAGLFDYFKQLGDGISKVFADSFDSGSISAKQFSDDTISFMNSIIKAVGFVAKALAGVANLARTVYGGIQKLAGTFVGGAADERLKNKRADLAELQKMVETGKYGIFSDRNYGVVRRKIIAIKKEIASTVATQSWAKDVRASGDATVEAAAKSQANINALVDKVTALGNVNRATIKATTTDIDKQKEAATKALGSINAGYGQLNANTKKLTKNTKASAKAQSKAIKDTLKEAKKDAKEACDAIEEYNNRFANSFASAFEGVLGGDIFSAFDSFFNNISTTLAKPFIEDISKQMSKTMNGILGNLGVTGSGLLGIGLGLVGSLFSGIFSSTVSQGEIDAVKGRVDFSDESLKNMGNLFSDAINPLLPLTERMSGNLDDINQSMFSFAKAVSISTGISITGAGFTPTSKSNFFSGKSTELIDSSLRLNGINFNNDVTAQVVQQILTKKSTLFGLIKKEKISTITRDAGSELNGYLTSIMEDGKDIIISSANTLGFDVSEKLKEYESTIGDISFKGLNPQETEDRLNAAFAEIFSGAIGSLDGVNALVDTFAKSGEENLETLTRIAVEYEQASFILTDAMKGAFSVFGTENTLDLVNATGGLTGFGDAITSFRENFFTDTEKLKFQTLEMRAAFESLGVEMPRTNDQFRTLIENTSDGELAGNLLALNGQFANMTSASLQLKESFSEYENKLEDFMLGQYSRLSEIEKLSYANNLSSTSTNEDDLFKTLEFAYSRATSESDYRSYANRYENFLEKNTKETVTLDDVNKTLITSSEKTDKQITELQQQNTLLQKQIDLLNKISNKSVSVERNYGT